jgi:hypothetical protein
MNHALELSSHIVKHPRAAVGVAFGLGAVIALLSRSRRPFAAAVGALAMEVIKDLMRNEAAGWWADRTERDPSRDAFSQY